jgi:hypothetical protein
VSGIYQPLGQPLAHKSRPASDENIHFGPLFPKALNKSPSADKLTFLYGSILDFPPTNDNQFLISFRHPLIIRLGEKALGQAKKWTIPIS